MELLNLPEEILIIIIRDLDLQTLYSMYNTCSTIRNVVCMHGVIKECHMSMNVMATVNTLKLNFFKDISSHLLELNMCGVPDLYKSKVLPAFKKLKSLRTLDISYTNLHLLDFIDIYNSCPTIKNIHINFVFGHPGQVQIPQKTVLQCQTIFENFENVHFVGSLNNLLYSKLVLCVLEKTKLNRLKFSVVELDGICTTIAETQNTCQIPQLDQFSVYLVNWKSTSTYECVTKFPVLSVIEYKNYEFFIMYMLNMYAYSVYATPMFKAFFKDNFDVTIECVTEYKRNLVGNVAIMLWNKDTTTFDDSFFHKLYRHVKHYFPFIYNRNTENVKKYDWFCIVPKDPRELFENEKVYKYEAQIKKRRIALPSFVLNYDEVFTEKDKVQLSFMFNTHITSAIALTYNCHYLKKLTYLSLSGQVSYVSEFFNVLFRCCENLITLNVEAPIISPCAARISRSLPLSRTVKNIRLLDKKIDFKTIFSSFSQCQTLENIHILDHRHWDHCQIADPSTLIEKCANLYSVFIEAPLSETAQVKLLQMFNKAKTRCDKAHIRVVINQQSTHKSFQYNFDPFVDVFKLNPIKPTI